MDLVDDADGLLRAGDAATSGAEWPSVDGTSDVAASRKPPPDRRRAVLGAIVVVIVVAAAAVAIYRQRAAFANALDNVGVAAMLASSLVAVVGVALTYPTWHQVLRGLGVELPWRAGARVFFTSQLGKYLPGSVWPALLQMEAGRAHGASRRTMLAANLLTIVLSCAVGLIAASVLLPLSDAHSLARYWWLLLALPFLLALMHPRAVPAVLDRAFALARRPPLGQRLPVADSVRASAWALSSFVMQGVHVAILVIAIGGGGVSTVVLCTGGMALAVSAGVLFIPAPAGAGIRDLVLAVVLRSTLTSAQALAVVVASRAILIAVDLALAGAAALSGRFAHDSDGRLSGID
ncbi:MAG TPA: lysylphosphatidylglycerol synthase domain-containing protein [Jatrophihabitantaceae bacterium]